MGKLQWIGVVVLWLLPLAPLAAQDGGAGSMPSPKPETESKDSQPEAEPPAPEVVLPYGLPQETLDALLAFSPRRPAALPRHQTEEAYLAPIIRTNLGYARRMGLDAATSEQFMELVKLYGERRHEELDAAHQRLPVLMATIEKLLTDNLPGFDQLEEDAPDRELLTHLMIDTLRFRIEDHIPPVAEESRLNAFKAMLVRTEVDRESLLAACLLLRADLDANGNPWLVSSRISTLTRACDDAVKGVLTPEQYAQYLELRGIVRQANFEAVGSKHFLAELKKLELPQAMLERAGRIVAEKEVAADIRFERLVQLVGADRQAELTAALRAARAAAESETVKG